MINIDVESYCQDCYNFEPDVNKVLSDGGKCMTNISCVHAVQCRRFVYYLENKIKREESCPQNKCE